MGSKFLIRFTVLFTAIYFLTVFVFAWFGIYWMSDTYVVLLEMCVCGIMSSQGKYHCRYMKYTAYGLTAGDAITRVDNVYDWLPVELLLVIVTSVVAIGVLTSFTLALHHYYKVKRIKTKRNEIQRRRTE